MLLPPNLAVPGAHDETECPLASSLGFECLNLDGRLSEKSRVDWRKPGTPRWRDFAKVPVFTRLSSLDLSGQRQLLSVIRQLSRDLSAARGRSCEICAPRTLRSLAMTSTGSRPRGRFQAALPVLPISDLERTRARAITARPGATVGQRDGPDWRRRGRRLA